jgi:glycosyltransferase involved in cell wall biosynthesis
MLSISIVIPCLNEANTIEGCIKRARQTLEHLNIPAWEIIVADNGSTDGSQQIITGSGAALVLVPVTGYGAALDAGIRSANFEWIIFADGDSSYDFSDIGNFIPLMNASNDFIIGNRFSGNIEKGAMPFLHRYIGTPVISFIGRRSFGVNISDFNCGMRAIKKTAYEQLDMLSNGMEFATEMIAKASISKLKIAEVPVNLFIDKRGRKPHLNTWRDGWKHLRLILLLSPRLLLLYPAILFLLTGIFLSGALLFSYIKIFELILDIHTLYYASIMLMVGLQLLQFYVIARLFASNTGLDIQSNFSSGVQKLLSFERSLIAGAVLLFSGIAFTFFALYKWKLANFGPLDQAFA